MSCKIEIRKTIEDSINTELPNREAVMSQPAAINIKKRLNELWGEISNIFQYSGIGGYKVVIKDLEPAIEREYNKQRKAQSKFERDLDFFNNDQQLMEQEARQDTMLQKSTAPMPKASPRAIAMIKDLVKRMGVDISVGEDIIVNGIRQDANGIAQLMKGLIQVVEGKEAQVLPEEAMHFAVAIIKQTTPTLYKKLLSEINGYRLLKDVFTQYSNDPLYQTKDGKPNVTKLKEEAIGKVLAATIISQDSIEAPELLAKVESWWRSILDFIKNLISKSGFDRAAMDIITGKDIGTTADIKEGEDFLQKGEQETIWNKITEVASKITKTDDGYSIDGKKIPRRVTDIVKDWYFRRFTDESLLKSDYNKAVDELKAEKGTAGHADFEYAFGRLVDENGYLRATILDDSGYVSQLNPASNDMYNILRDNLKERLNSFPVGTRFKSEVTIYNGKGLAGTLDLLAITPNGKVSVLDWKFMNLNTNKYEDIPWYKVNAWRVQMDQYVNILRAAYGIKAEDFEQHRMIPILATYSEGNSKLNILPKLLNVKIGDVNIKNINEDYLIPVGLEEEKTGNKKLDSLIEKLNADYRKLSEKTVSPTERQSKAEQLNTLFKAIRQLQMKNNLKPLLYQSKILNKHIQSVIKMYHEKYEDKDGKIFSEKEKTAFAEELDDMQNSLLTYVTLDTDLRSLFSDTLSPEDKQLKEDLRDTSDNARDLQSDLNDILNEFTAEIIVKSEGIDFFMSPEKIVKGITKWFASTSTLQTKAVEFLYKKANKAFAYAGMDTLLESRKLEGFKTAYETWAREKELSSKNYFDLIKKKDSNELINEFNTEFYSLLKEKIESKDTQWIRDNINVAEYNAFLKERIKLEQDRADNKHRVGTPEEISRELARDKANVLRLYNTTTSDATGWLLYDFVKRFPKESWQASEWKELTKPENKPAKDFYDYIRTKNEEYRELGYIDNKEARVFLPFVRKGLTEKLITGGNVRLGEQFFRDISIDEGDIGYGKIDPHSGKPIDVIPKYFTQSIEGEVSTDLFRTMAFYNEAAIRYKYLKDIEGQVRLVANTERSKKAIATSRFGKTEIKDGVIQYTPDNNENSQLLEDMMKSIIYGQRYLTSETFDQLLFKLGTWGETLNKKLGIDIFPDNLSERQVSVNKVLTNLNSIFQLSTIGLNISSAGSNLFGGNIHSIINAGVYFTKGDYAAAQGMIFMNKFNGTDRKKMLGALEYFLPLTENYNRELAKDLSLHTATSESVQDGLMYLMRQSDWNVQTSNFYAYLKNTIVQNGEVVNAREYLRSLPKYSDKYAGTVTQRRQLEEDFEEEVKTLVEEKGVLKLATIVDDAFVIPGVEQKSQSVVELRRKVQQISKNALGNLSEDDVRMINLNVYGKSFMVFKNWIPRLVDVRIGNMKYNSASDAYEWGRMRMVYRIMSEDLLKGIGRLRNSLLANEKGVDYMRTLFEKKKADYEKDTGKVLEMTESEFMDLVRHNVKSQIIDTIFMTTLLILVSSLKANAPDKDEDEMVKNQYRFMTRTADKFKDELAYFYDPTSLTGLVSQGVFPSIAFITNFEKAVSKFLVENWAIATGNEKLEKDTKVIKYWMKTFPFTSQMLGYLPMFYPEAAKDLGVKVQSNYGIR